MSNFDITKLMLGNPAVLDRGVPNMERIAIRVMHHLALSNHALSIGVRLASGRAIPIKDHFFWLGNWNVKPDDWIFVYTRAGAQVIAPIRERPQNNLISLFWGRPTVMFQNPDVVPLLFDMDDFVLGEVTSGTPRLR